MRKFILIAAAIVFTIAACTKIESTTLGSGLIPPVDGVNTFDTTLDVYTNTYLDSLGKDAKFYKSDDHVIGVIKHDPVFGKTEARCYFELKPTYYKYTFPADTSLRPDSAVLILSYRGIFGDSTISRIPQDWEVYEVNDTLLEPYTIYPVSKTFTEGPRLGKKTIYPDSLANTVNYGFENAKNQIRIPLDTAFARKLIKTFDTSSDKSGAYDDDTLFRKRFKGFVVRPSSSSDGNALIRINLLDSNTKLALFYNYRKKDTALARTNEVSYFRFSPGQFTQISASANYIHRDRTGSVAEANYASNVNDDKLYLQTTPGTFATIKTPALANFPNAIIHRAELVALQVPETDPMVKKFSVPNFLLLSRFDSTNKFKRNVPNDLLVSGGQDNFATFGGYPYNRTIEAETVKAYNFDLTRYVQGIVTRKDSVFTLRLSAPTNDSIYYTSPYPTSFYGGIYYIIPSAANNAADGRVVLGGGGAGAATAPYRMRLRIIYSKL